VSPKYGLRTPKEAINDLSLQYGDGPAPALILPTPAPGEFALGYTGRLRQANLKSTHFETMRSLLVQLGMSSERGAYFKALTLVFGLTAKEAADRHTILPVVLMDWRRLRGSYSQTGKLRRSEANPLVLVRSRAYFCPDCMAEQRKTVGFPYWHRAHQLPGVYWCPWHRTALLSCRGQAMQEALPLLGQAELYEKLSSVAQARNQTLQNFTDVMMAFLQRTKTLAIDELTDRLRNRAAELGLRLDETGNARLRLSDLAADECPRWWLEEVFGRRENYSAHWFPQIDGVLSAETPHAKAYALAVALLFAPREWGQLGLEIELTSAH
jgi:hypothetical protein